jgi:hypothetical protein
VAKEVQQRFEREPDRSCMPAVSILDFSNAGMPNEWR